MHDPDQTQALPAVAGAGFVAGATRATGARLRSRFDGADIVFAIGLVMLFAGLWRWWTLGVALSVVGAVVLVLGSMAVAAGRAQPVETPDAGPGARPGVGPGY